MGCAASTNVNTADNVKPTSEILSNDRNLSPKLNVDSGDIQMNENVDYGDQIENDRDIVEETSNFHNSPALSIPNRQSVVSISKPVTNSNKQSKNLNVENEKSKSLENKSNVEFEGNISQQYENNSIISSRASNKHHKLSENVSMISMENKIEMGLLKNGNSLSKLQESIDIVEKTYKMISPQESLKSTISSRHSNVVYKPTESSDDEIIVPSFNLSDPRKSQNKLNYANNSRSAMSESKTYSNQPCEFWNKNPQNASNANSLNNIEYEKSSRNSQFSHNYTDSVHSPFFDSLNHGNTNYKIEENPNHDVINEPIIERFILGTGDSEKWINAKPNYISEDHNITSTKSNAEETESSLPSETIKANFTATGDIYFANLEHSNEDNTLEIENNHSHNYLIEDCREFIENSLRNIPHPTNQMNICETSNHKSFYRLESLKTAEVTDSNCEGLLTGMLTSSPMNFSNERIQEYSPIIDQEEKSGDYFGNIGENYQMDDQAMKTSETKSPIIIFPNHENEKPE